jgi:hypothetical protein
MCGQGDWAYAYRSPSGRLVARVDPFEPGYKYFVDLCERCPDNRYVPRMDLATELEGGGHLAVLEHLGPADMSVVEGVPPAVEASGGSRRRSARSPTRGRRDR